MQKVNSPEKGNPFFHGGDVFISWLPTGEVRRTTPAADSSIRSRLCDPSFRVDLEPGNWSVVSYIDLNSGPVQGGKFWRITPMVNWHMSDNVRLEFVYGYGSLNRFDLVGKTQFFQTRLQLQLYDQPLPPRLGICFRAKK